ncbi:hypothetical protein T484DRAFT_1743418 [Baffinella frigidus]|nr:hypothetical protein T484DRAFT_1743418 [Cryptophyta sp. CCMP2293]
MSATLLHSNRRPDQSLPLSLCESVVADSCSTAGATPTSDPILINSGATPRHHFFYHGGPVEEKERAHSTGGARVLRTRSARVDVPGGSCSGDWVHVMVEVVDAPSLSLCDCAFALELEDDRILRLSSGAGRIHSPKACGLGLVVLH